MLAETIILKTLYDKKWESNEVSVLLEYYRKVLF